MRLRVGTSGYDFDDWVPAFYPQELPKEERLRHYAERFDTVEINNTFYRNPKSSAVQAWGAQVGDDFSFVLKASRRITHRAPLTDHETLGYLWRAARHLGEKLGPILFQMSPYFRKDVARLREFCAGLPEGLRAVFEFRNREWRDEEVFEELREAGAAWCVSDQPRVRCEEVVGTCGFGYLRFAPGGVLGWGIAGVGGEGEGAGLGGGVGRVQARHGWGGAGAGGADAERVGGVKADAGVGTCTDVSDRSESMAVPLSTSPRPMGICSTFVADSSVESVADAMTRLMRAQGYESVAHDLSPAERAIVECGSPGASDVWVAWIRPARQGWTAIETGPVELLCSLFAGSPSIASLASDLQRHCFHVTDGDDPFGTLVVEAAPDGRFRIRGHLVTGDDPLDCYGIQIPEAHVTDLSLEWVPERPELNVILDGFDTGELLADYMQLDVPESDPILSGLAPDGTRLLIGRRRNGALADPLILDATRESSPEGDRWILRVGDGVAWLGSKSLESPTPGAGRAFVDAVATWFDEPSPEARWTEPQPALWVWPKEVDSNRWRLDLGDRFCGQLMLTIYGQKARLEEVSVGQRRLLLEGIARALLVPEGFVRFCHPPAHLKAGGRLSDGRYVGAAWVGDQSVVWVWDDPTKPPQTIAHLADFAFQVLPHPSKPWIGISLVGPCSDYPGPGRRSFGNNNAARVSILDLETREERVVASQEAVDPWDRGRRDSLMSAVLAWRDDELLWSLSKRRSKFYFRSRDSGSVVEVEGGRFFARWPVDSDD